MNKLIAKLDFDKTDNNNINVSCLGKRRFHLNNTGIGKITLNFIKFLKAFCKIDFARKPFSMAQKTLSALVWTSHGSPLSIPSKESLQQKKPGFKEKNTTICKFKSTSRFFQHDFVREPDDLKLNPSDEERKNKEQVLCYDCRSNHSKEQH